MHTHAFIYLEKIFIYIYIFWKNIHAYECVYLYIHNKYAQYTHIYYVNKIDSSNFYIYFRIVETYGSFWSHFPDFSWLTKTADIKEHTRAVKLAEKLKICTKILPKLKGINSVRREKSVWLLSWGYKRANKVKYYHTNARLLKVVLGNMSKNTYLGIFGLICGIFCIWIKQILKWM